MSETKFCVNCKRFGHPMYGPQACGRTIGERVDIVFGVIPVLEERDARDVRADESSCGPEGKFFEAKPATGGDSKSIAAEITSKGASWEWSGVMQTAKPHPGVADLTYEQSRQKVLGETRRNLVLVGIVFASAVLIGSALLSLLLK